MLHMETISSFNPLQREHERLVILTNKKDLAINALKVQSRIQNFACVINQMFTFSSRANCWTSCNCQATVSKLSESISSTSTKWRLSCSHEPSTSEPACTSSHHYLKHSHKDICLLQVYVYTTLHVRLIPSTVHGHS